MHKYLTNLRECLRQSRLTYQECYFERSELDHIFEIEDLETLLRANSSHPDCTPSHHPQQPQPPKKVDSMILEADQIHSREVFKTISA